MKQVLHHSWMDNTLSRIRLKRNLYEWEQLCFQGDNALLKKQIISLNWKNSLRDRTTFICRGLVHNVELQPEKIWNLSAYQWKMTLAWTKQTRNQATGFFTKLLLNSALKNCETLSWRDLLLELYLIQKIFNKMLHFKLYIYFRYNVHVIYLRLNPVVLKSTGKTGVLRSVPL